MVCDCKGVVVSVRDRIKGLWEDGGKEKQEFQTLARLGGMPDCVFKADPWNCSSCFWDWIIEREEVRQRDKERGDRV